MYSIFKARQDTQNVMGQLRVGQIRYRGHPFDFAQGRPGRADAGCPSTGSAALTTGSLRMVSERSESNQKPATRLEAPLTDPLPQTIFAAVAGDDGRRHGTSLVEVMLAMLILVIAVIGVSSTYVSGRRELVNQRYYQAAAQLADQGIEELKATGYAGISEGEAEQEFTVNGLTYVRNTRAELTATPSTEVPKPCKKVTVTITWSLAGGGQHEARLVTYIGP